MANNIINDNEVFINGQKYTLSGPIRARYVERFPAKVNIGSDEYDREQFLSNWIIKDQRGGIGKEEMDESVDSDRCWWTNLICDYQGHMLLPRLATAISTITDYAPSGSVSASLCNGTGWSATTFPSEDASTGNYLYIQFPPHYCTNVSVTFNNVGDQTCTIDTLGTAGTWTNIYGGAPSSGVQVISVNITDYVHCVRLKGDGTHTTIVNACSITKGSIASTTGTYGVKCNFNSNLYIAKGRYLLKLDSDRAKTTCIWYAPANITAMLTSLNSKMYIFCGAAAYTWMNTSEAFFGSYEAGGNFAIQLEQYLVYLTTAGVCKYNATPDTFASSWTATGSINDIPSDVNSIGIGKDADGNDVLYAATKSWLKILSVPSTGMANAVWINTAVKLPDHPNGGKGYSYWHDGHFISYGLGVKKYVTGSTASVTEVGLNKDDGLPLEYNGEIVKLCGDSGLDVMFAAVDASQVTGTSLSGLYAYTGQGWRCWWEGPKLIIEDTADAWNESTAAGVTSTFSYLKFTGQGSASLAVADSVAAGTILATELMSATDISAYDTISLWIYSTVALTSGNLQLLLDNTANCATPLETLNIPAVSANTWTRVDLTLANPTSDTNIVSIGLKMAVDKGAFTVLINTVEARDYDAAMHDIIVSSAASSYAVYFDCGSKIYYIDIPRGISNPNHITQSYGPLGTLITPWFDAGSTAFKKLAKKIKIYSVRATLGAMVYYRLNKDSVDLDTGWTLIAVNFSGDFNFASGVGLNFNTIQYRFEFNRDLTTGNSPDMFAFVTAFRKLTQGNWYWSLPVIIDGKHGRKPREQISDIETAVESETDVAFIYRKDDTNETHYIKISLPASWTQTGEYFGGAYTLEALEA